MYQRFVVMVTGMEFLNLPFEVLQHVSRHLDSFSLCNLALTCKLLRDVCCSLLDERGIVIQVWEKVKDAEQKVTWQSFCNVSQECMAILAQYEHRLCSKCCQCFVYKSVKNLQGFLKFGTLYRNHVLYLLSVY